MTEPVARRDTITAFLDAAERLLLQVGHAGITTRRLAEEAGANPGLVHYYFGSMEELFVQVLERFTDKLVARQRDMYAEERPFLEKWREAMRYLEADRESGYHKIWLELQALAWNRPELRERIAQVLHAWRTAMSESVAGALREYDLDTSVFPLEAWVTLIVTFNEGIILERLCGIRTGQDALMDAIDRWLATLEQKGRTTRVARRAAKQKPKRS